VGPHGTDRCLFLFPVLFLYGTMHGTNRCLHLFSTDVIIVARSDSVALTDAFLIFIYVFYLFMISMPFAVCDSIAKRGGMAAAHRIMSCSSFCVCVRALKCLTSNFGFR